MTKYSIFAALAAAPVLLAAQPALAGTTGGQLPVSATVLQNCTVLSSNLAFGAITDVGAANVDSTAVLTLVCTANAGYEIQLDDGANGSAGQRRMANAAGTEFIAYDIYKSAARTDRWGQSLNVDTVKGKASLLGTSLVTAYGRIPAGVAKVSAGSYTDTVTITVNF